jgi:hypothetical protein
VFTASTDSAVLTVKHGLDRVPIAAGGLATAHAGGLGDLMMFDSANSRRPASTSSAQAAASTVNIDFYWLAVA